MAGGDFTKFILAAPSHHGRRCGGAKTDRLSRARGVKGNFFPLPPVCMRRSPSSPSFAPRVPACTRLGTEPMIPAQPPPPRLGTEPMIPAQPPPPPPAPPSDGDAAADPDAAAEARRQQLDEANLGVVSEELFVSFEAAAETPGLPHPADVAEPASLAATPPPQCTYPLLDALPSNLVSSGALSSLQLQFVGLACQRHLTVMPTDPPTRAGFFLGDGAGVGKGRQLAAVLLDSLAPMSHSL